MKRHGVQSLHSKLIRLFLVQLLLISLATLAGVYVAAKIVEHSLVREALKGEARHYWARFDQDPDSPRPDTHNLTGYLAPNGDLSEVPLELRGLQPGYARAPLNGRTPIVYINQHRDARIYLVFDEEKVSTLSLYFGIVPLIVTLLAIYLLLWFAYRQSHRLMSPVIQLARAMDAFDIRDNNFSDLNIEQARRDADAEVAVLIDALDHFTERLEAFIERERLFTRDVSHELRTPLAVIKGSVELLARRQDLARPERQAVERIADTVSDMEALIQTLLLLAREGEAQLPEYPILLNDLVVEIVDKQAAAINQNNISLVIEDHCLLELKAPEKVLSILLGNLIRNALSYTHRGQVTIRIEQNRVTVEDSGIGMSDSQLAQIFEPFYRANGDGNNVSGHGLGLAIIKRLCNRFDWQVSVSSSAGMGTTVAVQFPRAARVDTKSIAMADRLNETNG